MGNEPFSQKIKFPLCGQKRDKFLPSLFLRSKHPYLFLFPFSFSLSLLLSFSPFLFPSYILLCKSTLSKTFGSIIDC